MRIAGSGQLAPALARERGVALPVAISVLFVVMSLTGVAATSAITATHQSERDKNARRALAAVQAGIAAAVHRLNTKAPAVGQCVWEGAGGALTVGPPDPGDSTGWCPTQSEPLGDGESFVVRTSAGTPTDLKCQTTQTRRVVSTGSAGNVTRRAIATVSANTGPVFGECALASWSRFVVDSNSDVYLRGDVVANGDAVINGASVLCGDLRATDLTLGSNASHDCGQFTPNDPAEPTPYKLRKVKLPPCLDTPRSQGGCNDNERITLNGSPNDSGPNGTGVDPLIPHNGNATYVKWDEPDRPRELVLRRTSTLTLTGNAYKFCRVDLEGLTAGDKVAGLYIAPRNPGSVVKIYFEAPEKCLGQGNTQNFLRATGRSAVVNTNPDPTTLQIYMVGTRDPGRLYGTRISINNNPLGLYTNAVIYAPRSKVIFKNKSRLVGAVAAKRIQLNGKARILWSDDVMKLNGSNFSVLLSFSTDSWAECAPLALGGGPGAFIDGCRD